MSRKCRRSAVGALAHQVRHNVLYTFHPERIDKSNKDCSTVKQQNLNLLLTNGDKDAAC